MAYPITKRVIPILFRSIWGKCVGLENIPNTGVIIAANHASYIDHFIIATHITRHFNKVVYFLSKKEHFEKFWERQWHKYLRAIPIDRESGGKEGLDEAIAHLKKGHIIMIYPEGTRTLTGKLNRGKTGVARLALEARVPVVPIGITNTFYILPKGKFKLRKGKKADLYIGKPLYFDKYYGQEDKKTLRKITTIIMKEIAKLTNQEYTE